MSKEINEYPSLAEANTATMFQLGRWRRFLRSPTSDKEREVLDRIMERFREGGGWTPEISKAVGW